MQAIARFILALPEQMAAIKHILNRRQQNSEMKELAKRFIGEECIIYTITSNDGSVHGVLKEIDEGGMVIEKKTGELEIINLDFVTHIRQYPRKKKGHHTGLNREMLRKVAEKKEM